MGLRSDVHFVEGVDGGVLFDELRGRLWRVNPTGAQVIRGLADRLSPDSVAQMLTSRHAADSEVIRADIEQFVADLRYHGLLEQ